LRAHKVLLKLLSGSLRLPVLGIFQRPDNSGGLNGALHKQLS
jgi:hypothetical protein